MASTQVDRINIKVWVLSIICSALTFINVTVYIVSVHFPNLGFPCVYFELIDFQNLNLSISNDITRFTPQLYLDSIQLICYVVFTNLVFFVIIVYYIVCAVKICYSEEKTSTINQSTKDIMWMGDNLSCFQFVLIMDCFQFFIVALSFRLAMLASLTFFLYFICLTAFMVTMLTQYQSSEKSAFALSRLHPRLRGTVKYKTALINIIQFLLGYSIMVFSITLCLGLGNSFFIKVAYIAFSAINTFLLVFSIYFIVLEAILYRYVKVQFGLHAGIFCGICGLTYPIIKYESIFASQWIRAIAINIGILAIVWLAFTVCRLLRFLIHKQQRYKPLSIIDENEESTT